MESDGTVWPFGRERNFYSMDSGIDDNHIWPKSYLMDRWGMSESEAKHPSNIYDGESFFNGYLGNAKSASEAMASEDFADKIRSFYPPFEAERLIAISRANAPLMRKKEIYSLENLKIICPRIREEIDGIDEFEKDRYQWLLRAHESRTNLGLTDDKCFLLLDAPRWKEPSGQTRNCHTASGLPLEDAIRWASKGIITWNHGGAYPDKRESSRRKTPACAKFEELSSQVAFEMMCHEYENLSEREVSPPAPKTGVMVQFSYRNEFHKNSVLGALISKFPVDGPKKGRKWNDRGRKISIAGLKVVEKIHDNS